MPHQDSSDVPFGLTYGQSEDLLVTLTAGKRAKIASRFRKLRPKFAADDLLTKTGNHVKYDLARVLSMGAIFTVNSLGIPQSHAVEIVVSNWPEIARACILTFRHPPAADVAQATTLNLYIDALDEGVGEEDIISWGTTHDDDSGIPHAVMDMAPILDALKAHGHRDDARLDAAFNSLEEEFGWGVRSPDAVPLLPARIESEFFGTGPYFQRARALMSFAVGSTITSRQELRLQTFLDYLESPPPVDAWKQYIGADERAPRLVHILGARGAALGLRSKNVVTETLVAASDDGAAARLIALGEMAQREISKSSAK